ncbi:MAG: HU family DNA-binding protein [Paramuribaculum sp.]|nr:HU family DNA-binding protein [Paramuribaculum sp.]
MNNKIPLKKFAEAFSKESNLPEAEAEAFIRQLFDIVASELKAGFKVRINGIGTFSLSASAGEPVVFVPDDIFAQEINAPFSIFQPVPLAEGVTEEDLARVEVPELSQPQAEEEPQPEPLPELREEPVVQEIESAPASIPEVQETPETDTAPEAEPVKPVESGDEFEVEQPVKQDEAPEVTTKPEPATPADTTVTEIVETPAPEEAAQPPAAVPEWEYEEEEYVQQPAETKSRFGAGFVIGLIVGLAIGALVLCAYIMYYVNATPQDNSVETELIESHISPVLE